MEPISIALICAAAFGVVVAFSAFIRQIFISRDKNLNDEAQRQALSMEANELEKMRDQMQNSKRFDSHYKVLGVNKDAIEYLDKQIEEILSKKSQLVERFAQVSLKESTALIEGESSIVRKEACDKLRREIDDQIHFYEKQLDDLQQRRKSLWDAHTDMEKYILNQEQLRNDHLDKLYKQHTGVLEKVFIRHTENSEHIAKQSIEAGTTSFKMMILAPIQFLLQYFNLSTGISLDQAKIEKAAKDEVEKAESDINDSDSSDIDIDSDKEDSDKMDDKKDSSLVKA